MKVLMTGGTGLIGTRFIEQAYTQNHYTILTRNPKLLDNMVQPNVQYIESLNQYKDLNNFDVVINLAGEPIADRRWSAKQKQRICESRWQTTDTLATFLARSSKPPQVVISASAVGFYGREEGQVITESYNQITEDFSHKICKVWEQKALQMAGGTRVCLLRTGIVLDKYGGALKKMLPAFRFGMGGKLASGEQYMPWIHIDDMIRAMEFLINNEKAQGAFNLTAPNPVTNVEFSQTLADLLHRPCLLPLPEKMLRLLFGEMADLLIYGQNTVPEKLLKLGFQFKYSDFEPALANILRNGLN